MDNQLTAYLDKLQELFKEYESKCKHCGACCGMLDSDSCVNLIKDNTGKFYCCIYDKRLGSQKSLSGKFFNCISIREILRKGIIIPGCGYNL